MRNSKNFPLFELVQISTITVSSQECPGPGTPWTYRFATPHLCQFLNLFFNLTYLCVTFHIIMETGRRIVHARLRMNCSSLNGHLFINHVTESPWCACGAPVEDNDHFFFFCPFYTRLRYILLIEVQTHCIPSVEVLLQGCPTCTQESNQHIFLAVHDYIINSSRFD